MLKTTAPDNISHANNGDHDRGPAVIGFDAIESKGNDLLVAANGKNWESEQVAESASTLLDGFERLIFHGTDTDNVIQTIDEAIEVSQIRPASLTEVFKDDTFTVHRAAQPSDSESYEGQAAFREQLKELGQVAEKTVTKRFEQKVTRVQVQGTQVSTRSLVHITGESDSGVVQANLVWECGWILRSSGALRLQSLRTVDYEEIHANRFSFVDCTQSVLGRTESWKTVLSRSTDHWLDRLETRYGLDPAAWHGLAVGDVNNDGLDDVYVSQSGGLPNALLIQRADGTVDDVAEQTGVNFYDQTQSALFVDLDNDGDQDLAVAIAMGITILENDGVGNFTPKAAKLMPEGVPYSISAADYDGDGRLDLYACSYSKRKSELGHRFLGRPIPYHDAKNGARNALFRNAGDWQFFNVTKSVGMSENNDRFSFASSWEDFDNDGDLDLYVANDYGRNNLYRNDELKFSDVAADAGLEDMSAGMSVSWGDVDNDGWMDLYVSNMFSSAGNRVTYQRQFKRGADARTLEGYQRHARGNSLFINSKNGKFKDISVQANVTMGRWAWGSTFVDINSDGLKDIVVSNGFLTQDNADDL